MTEKAHSNLSNVCEKVEIKIMKSDSVIFSGMARGKGHK